MDTHSRDALATGETERRVFGVAVWRGTLPGGEERRLTEAMTRLADHPVTDEIVAHAASQFSNMNHLARQPRRAPDPGRFDADADAWLPQPTQRNDPAAGAQPARQSSRPAVVRPRLHHARPRAAASTNPVGSRQRGSLPCQLHDPDLWFADAPADLERAKALCARCPARLACLTGALDRREPTGVWGGHILDQGEIVTYKRARGRPSKHTPAPQRYPAVAS